MPAYIFILFLLVVLWLFLIRPRQRQMRQQQAMLDRLEVGDEIVTAGGLLGEIREMRDDEVLVRIAPELDVRIARRAIAGVTPQAQDELEPAEEAEEAEEPEETGRTPGT